MKNLFTITSIIFLACAATNVAHADSQSPESLTVQFGDLSLDRAEGVAVLFKRIKAAAEKVCRAHDGDTLLKKRHYRSCVDAALANAVTRVDRPVLSQYLVERLPKARKASVPVASNR